jgi:PadR family transcriptional regulator PadR
VRSHSELDLTGPPPSEFDADRATPLVVFCGILQDVRYMSNHDLERLPHLSRTEEQILELLIARGEMYGLEMVRESCGALKKGTIYVTLGRMEEKGYVESRQEERPANAQGIPRRLYTPTGLGARVARAWQLASGIVNALQTI